MPAVLTTVGRQSRSVLSQWDLSDQVLKLCRDKLLYALYSEGLDMLRVFDLTSTLGHEGTRTNQGSRIIYITEKPTRKPAQCTTFELFIEAGLFRLTGWFHNPLDFIYLSKYLASFARYCHIAIRH